MKSPQTYPKPAGGPGPDAWQGHVVETRSRRARQSSMRLRRALRCRPRAEPSHSRPLPGRGGLREATARKGHSGLRHVHPARRPAARQSACSEAALDSRPCQGCPSVPCSPAPAMKGTQPLLGSTRQRPHGSRAFAENFSQGGGEPGRFRGRRNCFVENRFAFHNEVKWNQKPDGAGGNGEGLVPAPGHGDPRTVPGPSASALHLPEGDGARARASRRCGSLGGSLARRGMDGRVASPQVAPVPRTLHRPSAPWRPALLGLWGL